MNLITQENMDYAEFYACWAWELLTRSPGWCVESDVKEHVESKQMFAGYFARMV